MRHVSAVDAAEGDVLSSHRLCLAQCLYAHLHDDELDTIAAALDGPDTADRAAREI